MRNKKATVLIVDDHTNFVDRMVGLLDEAGGTSRISTAGSYQAAVHILEQHEPDVIVLDISMPDKNGMDLLQYISQNKYQSTVVMLSNLSATYYQQECKRLGADYFLDKTTEYELVTGIIDRFNNN